MFGKRFVAWTQEQDRLDKKLGCRGHGEKRVQDALAKVYTALRGVDDVSVHGNDEERGLYAVLAEGVEKCVEVIPGDEPYWENTLRTLASVVGLAFELGRYAAGEGAALERLQKYAFDRRLAGETGGARRAQDAAVWRAALTPHVETHRMVAKGHEDWRSRLDTATIAKPEVDKAAGKEISLTTITDAVEEVEKKLKGKS